MSIEATLILNFVGLSAALYFYIHNKRLKEKLVEALKQSREDRLVRKHLMRNHLLRNYDR